MNRKLMALILCLTLMLTSLAGFADESKLTIKANNYPLYDMARAICGDLAVVEYVADADAATLGDCDLFLCQGGEADAWTAALEGVRVLKAADHFVLVDYCADVLTAPVNIVLMATEFTKTLVEMDTANGMQYDANRDVYMNDMFALDAAIRDALKPDMLLCAQDANMLYFTWEYGVPTTLNMEGAIAWQAFFHPVEEDLTVPYIQLMERNLETLRSVE